MFNSTLTKNEDFLCPVDGSIMITGSHHFSFLLLLPVWIFHMEGWIFILAFPSGTFCDTCDFFGNSEPSSLQPKWV